MRFALLLLALLLLAGCSRSSSFVSPSSPTSGPTVPPSTAQQAVASKPATTRASIADQPIRTPVFEKTEKHELGPNGMYWLGSSRQTKHNLTVTLKATPATAKVGVSVMLQQDFEASRAQDKSDIDPKAILGSNMGTENVEVKAAMPAVLPYVILLRNYTPEKVNVELSMKAQ